VLQFFHILILMSYGPFFVWLTPWSVLLNGRHQFLGLLGSHLADAPPGGIFIPQADSPYLIEGYRKEKPDYLQYNSQNQQEFEKSGACLSTRNQA
jgi:hypothetical protein